MLGMCCTCLLGFRRQEHLLPSLPPAHAHAAACHARHACPPRRMQLKHGSYEVNPPFVPALLTAAAQRVLALLQVTGWLAGWSSCWLAGCWDGGTTYCALAHLCRRFWRCLRRRPRRRAARCPLRS